MKLKMFVKNNVLPFIASLFGIKTSIKLIPMSDLTGSEQKWISTGIDPVFLLQGTFFWGWNEISWDSEADQVLNIKIYWDFGNGFSEENSNIFTSIRTESKTQRSLLYIPKGTRQLRLDPGEQQACFKLSKVTIKKITRLNILIKIVCKLLKQRGYNFHNCFELMKKIFITFKKQGTKAVWNKIKDHVEQGGQKAEQDYEIWISRNTLLDEDYLNIKQEIVEFHYKPLISIILPVYNIDEIWLRKCIDSVLNQLYPYWELCIADDASPKPHIRNVLEEYTVRDSRIKVIFREKNGHISEASNSALTLANGEFIGLLDHDDELSIDALYENAKLLNKYPEADMIYSDEDKITVNGERHSPFFKPDYASYMLLTHMYTCHFGVYRFSKVREAGGFRQGFEGSQDYDLALRITEKTNNIYHIPKILYHWRTIPESTASGPSAKNYTHYAGHRAVTDAIKRRNINGWVEELRDYSNFYRIHYRTDTNPMVSIIIPTRDASDILSVCLDSIFAMTKYSNYEVIIVDNGSKEEKTFNLFNRWEEILGNRLKILKIDVPFNYSILNNKAVEKASGDFLLLLNNDTEIKQYEWLDDLVGIASRQDVGAVGAYLQYPDRTIQHSGLVLGLGTQRVAGDGHHFRPVDDPGYFGALLSVRNVAAVTAACLIIKKSIFIEVNGFDENLSIAYNDVDFCLKVREKGYQNIWLPYVQLIHYESKTRGLDTNLEKLNRLNSEADYMKKKWGAILLNDPYYSCNLSLDRGYSIKI